LRSETDLLKTVLTDADDLGLQHDLLMMAAWLRRRRLLLLRAGAAAVVTACGGGDGPAANASSASAGTTGAGGSCVAYPTETNGPLPSDGANTVNGSVSHVLLQSDVVRSDLRSSVGGFSGTAAGVPLTLAIT
jgi:hypothetical protein